MGGGGGGERGSFWKAFKDSPPSASAGLNRGSSSGSKTDETH